MTPENRRKMGQSRSEAALAWCPPEYRDENAKLKGLGFKVAERKIMIADLIRADEKALAPIPRPASSKFEEQLAKVAAGASVSTKCVIPGRHHAFTIGGVSAGML